MAHVYVRSGAAGAGTGADWANAYTTLAAALAAKLAGDDFWVAADHAETGAAATTITLTAPGTAASPNRIICVNHAGSVPPVAADLATTATIASSTTGQITFLGNFYAYGISFNAGTGASGTGISLGTTANHHQTFESCNLSLLATGSASIAIGTSGSSNIATQVNWLNTKIRFSAVGQSIAPGSGVLRWVGSSVDVAGTIPTNLFNASGLRALVYVSGVDLSAIGAGKTLVGAQSSYGQFIFSECKLHASLGTKAAQATVPTSRITFVRCNSGAVNYSYDVSDYYGAMSIENTIVLTGGASDGTNSFSHKLITTANAKWITPFRADPIQFWQETVGAPITVTLQGIWGGGSVPNNDDIWMEVEYLGDAGSPVTTLVNCSKASTLATNAALPAGAGTWGGSTTKFALAVTFTPAMKGPVSITLIAAAASSTFYVDPKPVVT